MREQNVDGVVLCPVTGTVGATRELEVSNGLLIMADAAAHIAHVGGETYLRNRRLVGAGRWKHIADLT
jgi:hypothetical protein